MKVRELRKLLEKAPDEAEVVIDVMDDHHTYWVNIQMVRVDPNLVIIETGN